MHDDRSSVVLYQFNAGGTDLEAVGDPGNAFDITYDVVANQLGSAGFSLPADDRHVSVISNRTTFVEIWDGEWRVGLFRVVRIGKVDNRSRTAVHYHCEDALGTLNDDEVRGSQSTGPGTETSINFVLGFQQTAHWELGTLEFDRQFLHTWVNNPTVLEALLSICSRWADEYMIQTDTSSYPWTISIVEPPTDYAGFLHRDSNMQEIQRIAEATGIVTRIYPYGAGAGTDQLTIASENITGQQSTLASEAAAGQKDAEVGAGHGSGFSVGDEIYIEDGDEWEVNEVASVAADVVTCVSNLLHTYGVGATIHVCETFVQNATEWNAGTKVVRTWVDQRYTVAANLLAAANEKLAQVSTEKVTIIGEAADLVRKTGADRFELGKLVKVWNDPLGIIDDVRVMQMRKPDVDGRPGELELVLANKLDIFPAFGDAAYADTGDDISGGVVFGRVLSTVIENGKIIIAETVGDIDFENVVNAGDLYDLSRTPGTSSLYLGATYMGYYNGSSWTSYIKGDGTFKFYGDANNYVEWDGATLTVRGDLDADDISTGSLSATYISGGTMDLDSMTVTGDLSASRIDGGTLNFANISRSSLQVLAFELASNSVTPAKIDMNAALDFEGHDLYNVAGIRGYTGTSSYWIDLWNHTWYGYNTSSYLYLGQDVSLRGSRDVTIDAQGGDIYFRKGSITKRICFYDMQTYAGKTGQNLYIPINVNGTDYTLRLFSY
jgi:phage minor structural protein